MKFFKEFKEFAMRGNVIDLAVGVVIGSAFTAIVNALVTNVITPIIGLLTGGVDLTALSVTLGKGEAPAVLEYGVFLNAILQFIIVAFFLFLIVKLINKMRKPAPAPAPAPKRVCPFCKMEIADDATKCPHCTSDLN